MTKSKWKWFSFKYDVNIGIREFFWKIEFKIEKLFG